MVVDAEGREYLDALSGLWLVNVGHGREAIAQAMANQAKPLAYASSSRAVTLPAIELATLLSDLTPGDLSAVFFSNSGSEAVESALKITRQYHYLRGDRQRYKIIGRHGSYHGATYGAMSVSGTRSSVDTYFGPLLPGTLAVSCKPYSAEAIEDAIKYEGPNTVAAVIAEPISAAAGIIIPPLKYLQRLREICDRHGVLLIFDEVITGFGRTGKMFAAEHWDVVPDIMTVAKGLSSGYAPIGATICRSKIAQQFSSSLNKPLAHLLTFGGHAVSCAAALANLHILQQERLVENSAQQGSILLDRLRQLMPRHPIIGDVRGLGLFCAVELVKNLETKEPIPDGPEINRLLEILSELGVLTRAESSNLYLAPPLCIQQEQIEHIVTIVDKALSRFVQEGR